MAPLTARVFHSSVASPQPCRPGWSVSTLTKIQLRWTALTMTVSMPVIFTMLLPGDRRSVARVDVDRPAIDVVGLEVVAVHLDAEARHARSA